MSNLRALIAASLSLTLLSGGPPAHAAGTVTTMIAKVRADSDGRGVLEFAHPVGGTPPGCVAAGYGSMMAFNANTVGGRAILAIALAAKVSGSQVHVSGAGVCTHFVNVMEDVGYVLQM